MIKAFKGSGFPVTIIGTVVDYFFSFGINGNIQSIRWNRETNALQLLKTMFSSQKIYFLFPRRFSEKRIWRQSSAKPICIISRSLLRTVNTFAL